MPSYERRHFQAAFKISPTLAEILKQLFEEQLVTSEMLSKSGRVYVHRLRPILNEFGIEIESRRTVGYWLRDEAKTKIIDYLER